MKIISIITEKGGVGKTTTSIHLGAGLAKIGYKTLLVDFDVQRNLSDGYKIEDNYPYTIYNVLNAQFDGFKMIQKSENLFIICGDRNVKKGLSSRFVLKERLNMINNKVDFDFVIIDCPPQSLDGDISLGEAALCASDFVLSPIWASEFSVKGLNRLIPSIKRIKKNDNPNLSFLGVFFNFVEINTIDFRVYYEKAKEQLGEYLISSIVRKDATIGVATKSGKSVFQIAPKSRASQDFNSLVNEIIKKINNKND